MNNIQTDIIISSCDQTKEWRKNQIWYQDGRRNECEIYQIKLIQKIIKNNLNKTNDRINMETKKIINIRKPYMKKYGYEYTENFDGKIIMNKNTFYFNLKFICGEGGAQTRTLKDVYNFIKYQLKYLVKSNDNNKYFINILDGNESHSNIDKFNYLINKEKYSDKIKYVFIGDMYNFKKDNIISKINEK